MSYQKSNPNGQATMANSTPVVISSDQSTIPVAVSGVATAAKQDSQIDLQTTLITLVETLQELTQRLAPLAGMANAGAPSLRVTPITSVSTAVTGPITSAQSIAEKNLGGVSYPQRLAQENLTAIQANINNVTA